MQNIDEAYRMLDAFTSVGAKYFDVTFLDIDGAKRGFRPQQTARQLRNSLPLLLPGLTEWRNSLIVRPIAKDGVTLIQLDDLDSVALERVKNVAFLTLCTSPGNHQAWIALSGLADPKDFARRLKKGIGADIAASGAVRVAGTANFKPEHGPDFPIVTALSMFPGRVMNPEQLESFLTPMEERIVPVRVSSGSWPDYERCVRGAPINQAKTGPDISRADFFFAMLSAQRGHGIDAIAARLMELSSKARENGEGYARITAENASAACERGRRTRA